MNNNEEAQSLSNLIANHSERAQLLFGIIQRGEGVVDRMCDSIREFGFKVPILATSNGQVIDGHLRLKAAHQLQLDAVPVIMCDAARGTRHLNCFTKPAT